VLALSCTVQLRRWPFLCHRKDGIPHDYTVICDAATRRVCITVYFRTRQNFTVKNFANFFRMEFETFEELFQFIEPAIGKFGRPAVCCWFVRLCRSPNSTRLTRLTSWRLVTRKLATRRAILIWRFFNSFKSTFKRNFILLTHVKTIIDSEITSIISKQ